MLAEIRPEPSDVERAAIVAALERLLEAEGHDERAPEWWAAGLRDGLGEGDES